MPKRLRPLLLLLLSVWMLLIAPRAAAHPMSFSPLTVVLHADGTFRADLLIDSMEFRSSDGPISPQDREKRLSRYVSEQLAFLFDRKPVAFKVTVRAFGTPKASGEAGVDSLELSGTVPKGARTFVVQGSRELGGLLLIIQEDGKPSPAKFIMRAAYRSYPYYLGSEPPPPDARILQGKNGEPIFVGPRPLSSPSAPKVPKAVSSEVRIAPPNTPPTWTDTALNYGILGFEHILPLGLDHILFVLGLFLLSTRISPLLGQLTLFTIAHSVSLGLSALGFVELPASIVEPLIALSIVYVGLENVFADKLQTTRMLVIFVFGLLHGLGFAGVLGEIGLPRNQFMTGLLSFNVGVELGQIAVVVLAVLSTFLLRRYAWYRSRVVIPASCVIAAIGSYWVIERTLL